MSECIKELYKEREEMMETTIRGGIPKRVPCICACSTWGYYYKGYKPKEAYKDKKVLDEVVRAIYGDFYWDTLDIGPTPTFHPEIVRILKGGTFTFNDDGLHQTNPGKTNVMKPEEYPELIKDPYEFLLNKIFPRRYGLFREKNWENKYEGLCKVMDINRELMDDAGKYIEIAEKEYGIFNALQGLLLNPVDFILDSLRDFSGIISDIKRRPEEVRNAGLALIPYILDGISGIKPEKGKCILIPMHLPTFISPRDFEKVYWPSFKKMAEILVERGFIVKYAFERTYSHLFDYLQELPKNKVVGIFENDDIRVVKKKLGDRMCIQGGFPTLMFYTGTKEQCINHAKMLIDEIAVDGGYIFGTDKSMISPADGKAENLKAVNDFVNKYGSY